LKNRRRAWNKNTKKEKSLEEAQRNKQKRVKQAQIKKAENTAEATVHSMGQ
jgi:hypothetical protein